MNNKSDINKSNLSRNSVDKDEVEKGKKDYKRKKSKRSELTYILKFLNFVVGLVFLAFSIYCYSYGLDSKTNI